MLLKQFREEFAMSRADDLRQRAREAGRRARAATSEEERALLERIELGLNELAEIEARLERPGRKK